MANLHCSEFKILKIYLSLLIYNPLLSKFTIDLNNPVRHTAGFPKTGCLFPADRSDKKSPSSLL